jgi:pimeloyl-ACP methyl ester carboxylesterase
MGVLAGAVALVFLTGCVAERDEPAPSIGSRATTDASPQELVWSSCGVSECATLIVPLDWDDPTGETIGLELTRFPARGGAIGSLVINPGGPGSPGTGFVEHFRGTAGSRLLDSYDIVGFDPRGVGLSNPVECGPAPIVNAYVVTDYPMASQADVDAQWQRNRDFAEACRDQSGAIIEHMDTVSVAKDMDVLRAALGDEALNFLGFSYGTQLGYTYAQLFPGRVGRMVLDGALDPSNSENQLVAGLAGGYEMALAGFIEWCHAEGDCPLDSDPVVARQQVEDMAMDAIDDPVPATRDDVNGNLMAFGIVNALTDSAQWPWLSQAFAEVLREGTANTMLESADWYLSRNTATGAYDSNFTLALYGVVCGDSTAEDDRDWAGMQETIALTEAESPTFGWWYATWLNCDDWPFLADERVTNLEATTDAPPILVVGTTRDPATPYGWAESLTAQLGHATLLTYEGFGHTAYGRSNSCIIDAVDGFLVDGTMPATGTVC